MGQQTKKRGHKVNFPISKSITTKYLLLFTVILIVPGIIIYYIITGYASKIIKEDVKVQNIASKDIIAKRLNSEIEHVASQLQLIAGEGLESDLNINRMYNRAKQANSQSSVIHSIYYINEQKRVKFETPFASSQNNLIYHHPNFTQVYWTHTYALSDLIQNYHHQKVVTISVPVLTNDKEFKGIIVAELSRDYLSEVLKSVSLSRGHFGFLTDRKGNVIASTSDKQLNKKFSVDKKPNVSGYTQINHNGQESLAAYQTNQEGWNLVYGVPTNVAFSPLHKLSLLLRVSFISILLLALFFIWLGIKNILQPIVKLTSYAKTYRNSQTFVPLNKEAPARDDELSILTRTIIEMGNSNYEKQKMLEQSERYLHDVLEGIPYGIITIDPRSKITYVNQQFERMVAFQRQDMIGVNLEDLPIKSESVDFILLDTLASGKDMEEVESYILDSDGRKRIVKVTTSTFYTDTSEVMGIIAVMQDITEIKQLQLRLQQSDKLASIGQITAGIAHEIKNPLAILSGSAELLLDEAEESSCSEEVKELAADVFIVVNRLKEITNNFLNFANMSQKEKKEVSLVRVLEEVFHLLRLKCNEANISIVKDFEEKCLITGVYDQLIQVFLNIVLNAMEAMDEGGYIIASIQTMNMNEEYVVVRIEDTGSGINKQDLEWLFNPFYSTKETGSGLGLTIARDIVKEHGGELFIESIEGKGTTITCRFPKQKNIKGG